MLSFFACFSASVKRLLVSISRPVSLINFKGMYQGTIPIEFHISFLWPPVICLLVLLIPLMQDVVLTALVPVVDAHLQQCEEFCTLLERQEHLVEDGLYTYWIWCA